MTLTTKNTISGTLKLNPNDRENLFQIAEIFNEIEESLPHYDCIDWMEFLDNNYDSSLAQFLYNMYSNEQETFEKILKFYNEYNPV